jgi:hypothetical protein
MVALERPGLEPCDHVESGLRPLRHGYGHRTVQLDHGRRIELGQPLVERTHPPPVGGLRDVLGCDRRLQRVGPRRRGGRGKRRALLDLVRMPERAVLLLEQHQSTLLVHAGVTARVVQQHEREETARLTLVGHEREQHPSEPDRLVAQLPPHDGVRAGGQVALVEDQVQRGEYRAQPVRQLVVGGHLVRDARPADLALGAHQALLHGSFIRQEGSRHLGRGETAERAQRESHARLRRECRMAAGEEQPQPVVRQRRLDGGFGWTGHQSLELAELLLVAALAAKTVDRAVARRAHDPGAGVVREAVARPALERRHKRLLDRVLGEVEVAEDADQGGDRTSRLAPERALDFSVALYEAVPSRATVGSS